MSVITYDNITELMDAYGVHDPRSLGRQFYKETSFGVGTSYVKSTITRYWDMDGSRRQHIRNAMTHYEEYDEKAFAANVEHKVLGIKFHTIVEGSEAEFEADTIDFPMTSEDIQDAFDHLGDMVADTLLQELAEGEL